MTTTKKLCAYNYYILSCHSIKLLSLIIVMELLPDKAAQTQNPYIILILHYQGLVIGLGFLQRSRCC